MQLQLYLGARRELSNNLELIHFLLLVLSNDRASAPLYFASIVIESPAKNFLSHGWTIF